MTTIFALRLAPTALLSAVGLVACGGSGEPASGSAAATTERAFGNIDRERLLKADGEPGQWMTEGRDFGKSHFSALAQINLETIAELGFAWDYRTGTTRGLEANPIVVDGVLFTSGTTGRAYALDAATGEEIWRFDPESDSQYNRWACCDEVNRGLAVWEGVVYVGSFDGRLFGLDAATGGVLWEVDTIVDHDRGYSSSGAPEVAGDVVVIGNAGADYDARGYVSAYDLKTGELRWRFFTVPGDPALGYEHPELEEIAAPTWDPNSRWDVGGGGTVWNSMGYDPQLNLLYVGTGNAALFNWYERSPSGGDNLFLCSILAINPDTGRLAWYYQQVPREGWDYTATQPMILADLELDGQTRQVLMQAPKAGFFYILDRATGELLSADPYVPVNWATHVDLETGRPAMDLGQVDYRDGPVFVEPSGMGGHAWNPMAFNPDTGIIYVPAIEGGAVTYDPSDGHVYRPMQANSGNSTLFGDSMLANPAFQPPAVRDLLGELQASGAARQRAVLKAFDPQSGETLWEQEAAGFWDRAGVLATAGGLVLQGTDTGYLKAYNAKTGAQVLNLHIGTSIVAAPISYAIEGDQYIAVMAGWGGGGWFAPHDTSAVVRYGNDGRIIAFKLGGADVPIPAPVSEIDPIPEPPAQFGTPAQIQQGQQLFSRCSLCHANSDIGMTPDLRRMSPQTHAQFNAIVLYGARRYQGMPQWDDVLNEEQSNAIHAYLIDLAWRAYDTQEAERGDADAE